MKRPDNFDRQLYAVVGFVGGLVLTALCGFEVALGMLLGWGLGGLALLGWLTGRITFRSGGREEDL